MKLEPIHKLALQVLGGGALLCLSFFFHVVAFIAVIYIVAKKTDEFRFVYMNTKGFPYDSDLPEQYYQPVIPGTEARANMGTHWQRSVRTHVPENKGRWN